tara:strand:+ start:988 stop:1299 length:312 start_codon:yes stop_codon:yes gene_type:complete
MTIDLNSFLQILGLISSIIGIIWYISRLFGKISQDLSTTAQLNSIQDKKLETLESAISTKDQDLSSKIEENYKICRDGRVDLWRELNEAKLKIAKLEAKDNNK